MPRPAFIDNAAMLRDFLRHFALSWGSGSSSPASPRASFGDVDCAITAAGCAVSASALQFRLIAAFNGVT
jgi:hypothetical protein